MTTDQLKAALRTALKAGADFPEDAVVTLVAKNTPGVTPGLVRAALSDLLIDGHLSRHKGRVGLTPAGRKVSP